MRLRRVSDHGTALARHSVPGDKRPRWPEIISFGLVGLSLGAAAIIGVHVLAQGREGTLAASEERLVPIAAPIPVLTTKENPLRTPVLFSTVTPEQKQEAAVIHASFQQVARDGKEGLLKSASLFADETDTGVSAVPVRPRPRKEPAAALPKLAATPPVWKLERSWRLARSERQRLLAQRRKRLRERMCLAKAIYFEARSESIKGQMAVAKVILNRVRDPRFPNTICGVVYQGAERRNACQFSFACDGKPDYPTNARQWAIARRIAAKALKGQIRLRGLEGVAFYHADYVRPTWASMMRPVVKIGRHIFYRDS